DVVDLSLRIVLWQEASAERTWVAENGAPLVGTDPLIANFQHVARLSLVHRDRSDDRVWPPARIVHPELRQRVDWHARLHFIEKMRPGVGVADDIARIDGENGRERRIKHAELHRFFC